MGKPHLNTIKKVNLDKPTPELLKDLGMYYARPNSKNKRHFGLFRCPYCNKEFVSNATSILSGNVKSCGCYNTLVGKPWELATHHKGEDNASFKHGKTVSKLYYKWRNMINRITNPKTDRYPRYGGRGISICEEWMDSVNFINWAKSSGYEKHLYLDRIDNDGNYCPENCRWVTAQQSVLNRSHKENYGLRQSKAGKWFVYFSRGENNFYSGVQNSKDDAIKIRDEFIILHNNI